MNEPVTAERMTEDDLVAGLLDALTVAGWQAWHVRRSDRALWQGTPGWPDLTALPPRGRGPLLVIEAKSDGGRVTEQQAVWLVRLHQAGCTAALIRPPDYERAVDLILAGDASAEAWAWAFRP